MALSFGRLHAAILEMVEEVATQTHTARDIVRKAGLSGGGTGGGNGISVLTCSVADGERTFAEQASGNEPVGYSWDDIPAGFQNWFTWTPLQDVFTWWPDGYEFGFFTTVTDLSTCAQLKNSWVVAPGSANPDVNIRVMASLDAVSWEYPTLTAEDDWHFAGANVNCGQWLTYNSGGDPYRNYDPQYSEHESKVDALPGGWTTSGWHDLKQEYRAETVYLRWTADFSHNYDADPIYTSFDFVAIGYGEIRAR